jgi:hypothetical protein
MSNGTAMANSAAPSNKGATTGAKDERPRADLVLGDRYGIGIAPRAGNRSCSTTTT